MEAEAEEEEKEDVVADKLNGVLPRGQVPGPFICVGKVGDVGHLECDLLDELCGRIDDVSLDEREHSLGERHE